MTAPNANQALLALLQHEQQQRDRALAAHAQAQQTAEQAMQQAAQLMAYRVEYESRWATQFNRGGTMPIVMCYRSFMQRLDQAVRQQQHQAEATQAQLQRARTELLERERQLASVRKLLERRETDTRLAQQRHEQRQSDENALRAHWHGAPHGGPRPPN